jgi:hypothetical protein
MRRRSVTTTWLHTAVVDLLHDLTEALERHYCGQLLRHPHRYDPLPSLPDDHPTPADIDPDDPPF